MANNAWTQKKKRNERTPTKPFQGKGGGVPGARERLCGQLCGYLDRQVSPGAAIANELFALTVNVEVIYLLKFRG